MAANLPVVFLAFANSLDDHLATLKEESRNIFNTLQELQQADNITIHREESSEVDELYDDLLLHDGRIVIFHYGGHSDGSMLQLEGGVGGAGGIAKLLGQQAGLKLVFLNGCANKEQVKNLHAAGVPAVIATAVKINDTKATLFSGAFYKSLVQGHSIFDAFDSAAAFIDAKFSTGGSNGVSFNRAPSWDEEDEDTEESLEPGEFEWALYTREEAANDLKQWRLPEARSNWQTQLHDTKGPVRNLLGEPITLDHRSRLRTVKAAVCKRCGATTSLLTDDEQICAVCGSDNIDKMDARTELAEQIVPAMLSANEAKQSVTSALDVKSDHVLSLQPVYLPHWVFDIGTRTSLSAQRGLVKTFDTDSPALEWEDVAEEFDVDVRNFAIPAGTSPAGRGGLGHWSWDFETAEPLKELDSTFRVVPQNQPMQAGFDQVTPYFDNEVEAEGLDRIGGHQQRGMKTDTKYKHLSARSVLLPHWYATAETPNGTTSVIVNGQTGAVKFPRVPGLIAIDKEDQSSMSQNSFEPGGGKPKTSLMVSVYSGIGIGIMVGLLMGLAAPQGADAKSVVSIFIGAVGVGLAALLGLNDRHFSTAKGLRIGSFGLAVALSALSGIYVRDHGLFSPTLLQQAEKIRETFPTLKDSEVINLLGAGKTSSSVSEKENHAKKTTDTQVASTQSIVPRSYMYSDKGVDLSVCEKLGNMYDDSSRKIVLRNFRYHDKEGKLGWKNLADKAEKELPESDQKTFLLLARDSACSLNNFRDQEKPSAEQCNKVSDSLNSETDLNAAFLASEPLTAANQIINENMSNGTHHTARKIIAPVLCGSSEK
ncbi:MAG: hypothetical protein AAF542_09050 [Pseudomonadota bacterium]